MGSRRVVFGCTDRGQHRWTTLHTTTFHGDVQPGEHLQWTPVLEGSYLELHCPRCGRTPRLGHDLGGRLYDLAEQATRADGRIRIDVSELPV